MGPTPPPPEQVDLECLLARLDTYAARHGVQPRTLAAMRELLTSATVAALLQLPPADWSSVLVNDAYKFKMHETYAKYLPAVGADFALNVRRAPLSMADLREAHPALWQAMQEDVEAMREVQPLSPNVLNALKLHYNFVPCKVRHGAARATALCVL